MAASLAVDLRRSRSTGGRGVRRPSSASDRCSRPRDEPVAAPRRAARRARAPARGPSRSARSHAHRRPGVDLALDEPARLELLHALGQQPVGELRDGLRRSPRSAAAAPCSSTATIAPVQRARSARSPRGRAGSSSVPRAGAPRVVDGCALASQAPRHVRHQASRAQQARLLDRAVDRDLAGDVDHRREATRARRRRSPRAAARRSSRPRAPPRAGARRAARLLDERAAGSAAARPRCSSPESKRGAAAISSRRQARAARAARVWIAMPGLRAAVLGDGERDPLERRRRRGALAQLGAEARVAAQRRRASRRARRGSWAAGPPWRARRCRTGTEPSGAVSSSWIWNRLIWVFMASADGPGRISKEARRRPTGTSRAASYIP